MWPDAHSKSNMQMADLQTTDAHRSDTHERRTGNGRRLTRIGWETYGNGPGTYGIRTCFDGKRKNFGWTARGAGGNSRHCPENRIFGRQMGDGWRISPLRTGIGRIWMSFGWGTEADSPGTVPGRMDDVRRRLGHG